MAAEARALIGHTGFVGSNLLAQGSYQATFNSRSIPDISGRSFEEIVCAGVSAVKWWANRNPEADWQAIESLMGHLQSVTAGRFVLISTVDVYGDPVGVSEQDVPARDGLHAYGRNRLQLEDFVADRFANHQIVRLPGLFGPGLKKNVIFDLVHDNQLELINPEARFQWYPVARLQHDLDALAGADLRLINIVTEPFATGVIQQRFFPEMRIGAKAGPAGLYDVRTQYGSLLGGDGVYHMRADAVLVALADYLRSPEVSR